MSDNYNNGLNGDEEFQDYLDKDNIPIENQLQFIVETIEKKSKVIIDLFKTGIEFYLSLDKDDPLKKTSKEFISDLIGNSIHTINQFDYALIDSEEPQEEDNNEK